MKYLLNIYWIAKLWNILIIERISWIFTQVGSMGELWMTLNHSRRAAAIHIDLSINMQMNWKDGKQR